MFVLDLVACALVVAIEPLPISFLVLLLASERGLFKGLWFLVGWVSCIVVVLIAAALVSGSHPVVQQHHVSSAADIIKLIAGVLLIVLALRTYVKRAQPHKDPKWLNRLDRMSWWEIIAFAAFLTPQVVVLAAGASVLNEHLSTVATYLIMMSFVLLSSAPYLALVGFATFWPATSTAKLDALRRWLEAHRTQVLVILFLLAGVWLSSHALYSLASL